MMKITYALILFSILGVMFFHYETKNNYKIKEKEIFELKKIISEKHQNLKLMKAELAYLSRPERLESLAKNKLNMKEILPTDIWNISDLSKLYFEKK